MHDPDRTVRHVLARAVLDVARLVVPVACAGCGAPDVPWCDPCLEPVRGPARRREDGAPRLDRLDGVAPLPVWAPADYAGPLRDVVVAWKDRGRADLDAPLRRAARHAGAALRAAGLGGPGTLVVPAPTTGAARRARGRDPVAGLARAFATGLAAAHAAPLAQRRAARDQVGLGSRARGARLGTVVVRRRAAAALARDRPAVVLVDDVLTTGATLAACETALASLGVPVLGAFVLAATPAPDAATTLGRAAPAPRDRAPASPTPHDRRRSRGSPSVEPAFTSRTGLR
ncbi:ComF family protein [Cellulosimicrobium marinum]|uniref:ComF family protein n=1 Tax=Cellulosimicrobium marinum TaxID=1638992 RepID=UPI001E315077|nr:ComF family protein [Cellulosimicrobium marinum]MCB7137229.1 ComF family protein [Cellulosimicrobium marinum]